MCFNKSLGQSDRSFQTVSILRELIFFLKKGENSVRHRDLGFQPGRVYSLGLWLSETR